MTAGCHCERSAAIQSSGLSPSRQWFLSLSRLQHAVAAGSSRKKTLINNRLSILFMGGTVVAEYQACSTCFAGSVFDKKKKKGTQQI
jgi:hypothetical protein